MRIPHTIPRNVYEAYRCSPATLSLPGEKGRTICAEDLSWDDNVIPELRILALRAIVSAWRDNPLLNELPTCADRDLLLEILPTGLPFELVITRIPDGHYWERAAKDRWEYNNPEDHGNSWRRLYCERHLAEYLESLQPSYFETQKEVCDKLIELMRDHVYTIRLRSLVPTRKSSGWSEDEDRPTDEDTVHHILMGMILPQFPNLSEIRLNFGMVYMNDGFEWRDFEFSIEDCINLGEGIKACPTLKKFALTRSNLDRPRAAALLQGMAKNDGIEELDLSHCKLADTGAQAVGEYLQLYPYLKTLHLTNNNIGPSGAAGIIYGLLKRDSTSLKHLDLRLNPLQDAGGAHICALLLRNESLEVLNISGCDLAAESGRALADVLGSGCMKIRSLVLDISNNDFGPAVGEAFDVATKSSPLVVGLDTRMCNFSEESKCSVNANLLRNKRRRDREELRFLLRRGSKVYASQETIRTESVQSNDMHRKTSDPYSEPAGSKAQAMVHINSSRDTNGHDSIANNQ